LADDLPAHGVLVSLPLGGEAGQRELLKLLFEQAPSFMALVRGPEHRFEFANPRYLDLIGHRPILGRTMAEALPETVNQNNIIRLDQVYRSGEACTTSGAKYDIQAVPGGPVDERYLDFVYQPIFNARREVVGIFIEGSDVTPRVLAEQRRATLQKLTHRIGMLDSPAEIGHAAAQILGDSLRVTRVGYGTVDVSAETLTVEKDWHASPSAGTFAGTVPLRDYGDFIDSLKLGEFINIPDVRLDPRTAARADPLESSGARSFVSVPVMEHGLPVAMIYLNDPTVRRWSSGTLEFIREVGSLTHHAVERARAATELKAREAQLRDANETLERRFAEALAGRRLLADLVDGTDTFVQILDSDYRFLALNRANADEYERIYGVRPKVGMTLHELFAAVPPEQYKAELAIWSRALAGETFIEVGEFGDPRFARRWYELKFRPMYASDGRRIGAYQFSSDVTERLKEQARLAAAEAQLRQSQKMEAVGQLTGGLAHDFNNLLAGISGSLELLERRIADGRLTGIQRYITAAQGSIRRATTLTQRLLAFSRRQTLDPKPIDVNRLVNGMEELIRRSVGPDIEVEVVGAGGLWLTRVDSSQLENSLLNLALNARDAMAPNGGRLTIETANKWLDERAAHERDLVPGQYVSLCVTDTGCGMPPEVIARAFDPFFTTKPLGEGTGLGLSMVHGFVRQSGGQVRIYSEVGQGTTMCLYLPRFLGEPDAAAAEHPPPLDPGTGETVLVVDDEPTIRMLILEVLAENGYAALEARDGSTALRILQSDARIDLLITDVGLPGGIDGRQVADAARAARPGLGILFITGYAENAALGNGHLEHGVEVLTKPFQMSALASKIHDLIDR
jgi:signal transduction histidine kinase/CheY-like chemotaxis protein